MNDDKTGSFAISMKKLLEHEVAKTETGTPEHLNMYAEDVHGPGAIVRAVRELRAGRSVAFAICTRFPEGSGSPPMVKKTIRFAPMPGSACVRYAGEGRRPDGAGSSTVHGCGSIYDKGSTADLNPVVMAAYLSAVVSSQSYWYFLLADQATL